MPSLYFGEINDPQNHTVLKEYIHEINRFRFNWHPQMELMIVTSGRLEAYVEGSIYEMEEDDVLFINSNQGHATLLKEPGTQAMVLHLDPIIFEEILEEDKSLWFTCISDPVTRHQPEFVELRHLAACIMQELLNQEMTASYRVRGYAALLAAQLLSEFKPEQISNKGLSQNKKQDRAFHQMIKYSEKNYSRKITMEDLSELTGYNKTYLSTLFKKRIGIGYYEYLTRIRLRHGIHEMNKTNKTILEIALETGFADVKSFTLAFKKYFMKTPNQYRNEIENEKSPVIDELVRQFISCRDERAAAKMKEYTSRPFSEPKQREKAGKNVYEEKNQAALEQVERFYQNIKNILN